MKKAVVLSSGGVDSTTCISIAIEELGKENVSTVSVYYGQKHSKELACAKAIADYYGIEHNVIMLDKTGILDDSNCPLLMKSTEEIKHESYAEQIAKDGEGMVRTYVPFRNGLMLSSVAAYIMSKYPEDEVDIYIGAHADDAAGNAYADCSEEFTEYIGKAIEIGTYNKVKLKAPLVNLNKAEVVKRGLELKTPYELTWSCYEGGDKPCGVCATCIDRAAAFKANGVEDLALGFPASRKVIDVTWRDVEDFVYNVCDKFEGTVNGVYALPRGGLVLGTMISNRLNIPLLMAAHEGCLIVDDICDSGESLVHYVKNSSSVPKGYKIATMFYKENELGIKPDYYMLTKSDKWIKFPWE